MCARENTVGNEFAYVRDSTVRKEFVCVRDVPVVVGNGTNNTQTTIKVG